jgi:hypothetical protein
LNVAGGDTNVWIGMSGIEALERTVAREERWEK